MLNPFNNQRSQVAMEFLIIAGFFVLLLIPTIYLFTEQINLLNSDSNGKQFLYALNIIDTNIRDTCFHGYGAKRTIALYIPRQVIINSSQNIVYYYKDSTLITKSYPCNVSIDIRNGGNLNLIFINQGGLINVSKR